MKVLFKISFILLFVNFLSAAARPTAEDLQICYEKNKVSQFDYHGHTAVALTKNLAAVIADSNKTLSLVDYIKYDPYLQLYLVNIPTTLIAPFMMDEKDIKPDTWVNVLENNATQIGHIKSFANNLGEFDELSYDTDKAGILLCDCCQMVGIAKGGNQFIGARYLRNFIKYNDVYYGDIGVVFDNINDLLIVKNVNAFGAASGKLATGDIIKSVNNITPSSLRELNEMILFANKDENLHFEIERGGIKQAFDIKMISTNNKATQNNIKAIINTNTIDTNNTIAKQTKQENKIPSKTKPLTTQTTNTLYKNFGIGLDKNMIITRIAPNSPAKKAGFEIGDLIMQVEKIPVKTPKEFENKLSTFKINHVLVERNNFEFFIRLQK